MGVLCESTPLLRTDRGAIVEVAFTGRFDTGSHGNSDANEMAEYVLGVVKNDRPAAVLFNLRNLQYEFGDAIGGIALPLMAKGKSAIPACFVAGDTTARALQWFFQKNAIFGIAGFKMFADLDEAIAFLKERISSS
jgi:hypothetical protein